MCGSRSLGIVEELVRIERLMEGAFEWRMERDVREVRRREKREGRGRYERTSD